MNTAHHKLHEMYQEEKKFVLYLGNKYFQLF